MSANLVFATGPDNIILPFVVDVYKTTCKAECQTHLVISRQGVHIWIRLAWNDCEAAAAFASEPEGESVYLSLNVQAQVHPVYKRELSLHSRIISVKIEWT